jgi:hypothetical protein
MSQAGIISAIHSGPSIPDKFTTNYNSTFTTTGVSIPVANVLNVVGGTTDISNDNGVATYSNPDDGPNLIVLLTNRLIGGVTTVNAGTSNLITFLLFNTPASYRMSFEIAGRDIATNLCLGYTMQATVKSDGTTATIIEVPYLDIDQDTLLFPASASLITSGNFAILQVTGAAGYTITYKALMTYIMV